jgi:small subunit ribosomal protein S2
MKIKVPTIEELFDAGVHLGHQVRRWHPNAEPFIYEARDNIHVINLEKTHESLKKAAEFLYETAKKGEQIIFVGTKRQVAELLEKEAEHSKALYVNERWLGGTLTNFHVVKKNIDKLVRMRKKREEGEYEMYTKKEQLLLDREIKKLQSSVGGLVGIKGLPGALVVIDALREKTAVREARRKDIPVVALLDTDTDPTGVDYPIPGNDDAIKSTSLILKTLSNAVEKGYEDFEKSKKASEEKAEKEAKKKEEKQKQEKKAAKTEKQETFPKKKKDKNEEKSESKKTKEKKETKKEKASKKD